MSTKGKVLNQMRQLACETDIISYNFIIEAHCSKGHSNLEAALMVFNQMLNKGSTLDQILSVLRMGTAADLIKVNSFDSGSDKSVDNNADVETKRKIDVLEELQVVAKRLQSSDNTEANHRKEAGTDGRWVPKNDPDAREMLAMLSVISLFVGMLESDNLNLRIADLLNRGTDKSCLITSLTVESSSLTVPKPTISPASATCRLPAPFTTHLHCQLPSCTIHHTSPAIQYPPSNPEPKRSSSSVQHFVEHPESNASAENEAWSAEAAIDGNNAVLHALRELIIYSFLYSAES